jgi:central glycolytic genes regulator
MGDLFVLQQKIAPELIELIERRYNILRHVFHFQPVGRRTLALSLNMGERIVRTELDFFKSQGLLEGDATGAKLTEEGVILVQQLGDFVKELKGLNMIETSLREKLGLGHVLVVPGNSDQDELVKKELARVTAKYLLEITRDHSIIAVTGGTTLLEVANAIPVSSFHKKVLVVPARGGTERDVEIQANTIAARIAKRINGTYKLLHVSDNIGEDAMKSLSKDPHIKEIVKKIKSADILVYGIGNAEEISNGRGDAGQETQKLLNIGAVGEAFGHYFAKDGSTVKTIHTLGIRLSDLKNIKHVIGVAGGEKKAQAILAVVSNRHENMLVTDEAAAKAMLNLMDNKKNK